MGIIMTTMLFLIIISTKISQKIEVQPIHRCGLVAGK